MFWTNVGDEHIKTAGYRPSGVLIDPTDSSGYRSEQPLLNPLTGTRIIRLPEGVPSEPPREQR
jgi:hypothetical protein